jgi:hypothetical protein
MDGGPGEWRPQVNFTLVELTRAVRALELAVGALARRIDALEARAAAEAARRERARVSDLARRRARQDTGAA